MAAPSLASSCSFSNSWVQMFGFCSMVKGLTFCRTPIITKIRGNKKWHLFQFILLGLELVLISLRLFLISSTLCPSSLPNCLPCDFKLQHLKQRPQLGSDCFTNFYNCIWLHPYYKYIHISISLSLSLHSSIHHQWFCI